MNDCLPLREGASQRSNASVREAFDRAFSQAPDLSDLSPSARRVLVEAATLFHSRGAAATSVRDVASACGLTPGALYRHFASRDELLYRLVRHGHDNLVDRVLASVDTAPDDPVAAFVHEYVLCHLQRPEMARLVRRDYVHLADGRRQEIVERRRSLRDRLVGLLAGGAADGRLRLVEGPDAPTRTAMMILDMCSRTSEWYDPRRTGAEDPEHLADRYVEAAMRIAGAG